MEHFFRHEAGRIVSLLTKIFGIGNLQLAEDVVQETLLEAFNRWSFGAIPDNPSAWVMTVAKRKALNRLKRDRFLERHAQAIELHLPGPEELEGSFREEQIGDSMLRMFFVCCHPSLPPESRLALTLKILCGFGAQEIASAMLSNEAAVNKRLLRAKREFKRRNLPLEIPADESFGERIKSVHTCIYLLFNEGYNSSHPDFLIRKDLCGEAMRLCGLVIEGFPGQRASLALMSLMCFHAARFDSRIDDKGALVIFHRQDRSLWNRELIRRGHFYLSEAAQGEALSEYHLEAGIAAEHCSAKDFGSTRWEVIDRFYAVLAEMKDNPIIGLNRAIILSQTQGPEAAIAMLNGLKAHPRLKGYYLLHATLGELYSRTGEKGLAREHFSAALGLTASKAELDFLKGKLAET
ncbi:MAG TPA: sigma-70 family RNA polymerase sigma factor [Fibrobacteria bacterium]|nr:sigma-70 family RNA polymerase sigma factor [Fibrobacteria bacterium]